MNQAELERVLRDMAPVAVAVSGGVDSTTLAVFAGRTLGTRATMVHAISPAVPAEATRRVRSLGAAENWRLETIDAGEFADENYLKNPANRCFYCKTNLYQSLPVKQGMTRVSGTNLDDLADHRPGLAAAAAQAVRHPFVEAGMNKAAVRALAAALGLGRIAEMPSAPCLSSRIETGLRIDADRLSMIHAAERYVRRQTKAATVRCRLRSEGVVIELDEAGLQRLSAAERARLREAVSAMFGEAGPSPVSLTAYRRGSAFLDDRPR